MAVPPVPAPTPRLNAIPQSLHGLDNRGIEAGAIPGGGFGRFGRMFDFFARPIPDNVLRVIATAMIKPDKSKPINADEPTDENPTIPAGYTYFGQFVDHDISLDPTPLSTKANDLAAMQDFRSPALDLDCVYGRGPDDQPYMYSDGLHLRIGKPLTSGAPHGGSFDVLRLDTGGPSHPAILGDKRNDENRIVVQVQALFIAFHNKVVDDADLIGRAGGDFSDGLSRFRTAAAVVRWHYQWLVVNDYLSRILETGSIAAVLGSGTPNLPLYDRAGQPFPYMPVEFAGAAYRFGHSMVRPGYALNNTVFKAPGADDFRIPIFSRGPGQTDNLNGFGIPLPPSWGIDWAFYLDNMSTTHVTHGFVVPQPSYRIDANLVDPLADLPEFRDRGSPFFNLAYRNLARGANNLRLPSGEQVAHALGIVPLTADILWGAGSKALTPAIEAALPQDKKGDLKEVRDRRAAVAPFAKPGQPLNGNTPLWYYILREGEYFGFDRIDEGPTRIFGGHHLGPVGSRIVAETFIGLLWHDSMSYLRRWPQFAPMIPAAGAKFTLADVVRYAL